MHESTDQKNFNYAHFLRSDTSPQTFSLEFPHIFKAADSRAYENISTCTTQNC